MALLTTVLKKSHKRLLWNTAAEEAFHSLKTTFTTAPICHPDTTKPFVVEVNTSELVVGAILSLHFGEKPKLPPVAFFSKQLSLTGQNYSISNQELLAVKLVLEEWRHWLEGTAYLFTVFMDHKNLEYL